MIKELLLAIILGSLLGFGFTGSYLALKKTTPNHPPATQPSPAPQDDHQQSTPSPTPTKIDIHTQTESQLTIESPENESLITSATTTIKGHTAPQSQLVITTPTRSYFTAADNKGDFSLDIEIDSGANLINIDSFDLLDNQTSTKLLVTYSTAKI